MTIKSWNIEGEYCSNTKVVGREVWGMIEIEGLIYAGTSDPYIYVFDYDLEE